MSLQVFEFQKGLRMHNIHVRAGSIIGIDHAQRQTNCQDSYSLIETEQEVIGIVCDGCSEGAHSEVGATLAARYLAQQAAHLLAHGTTLLDMPVHLHTRLISFLNEFVCLMQPENPVEFIRQHLLFTVVGTVITPSGGVIFTAGDGMVAIDATAVTIDQSNQPAYIAYHLLLGHLPRNFHLPDTFDVVELPPDWQRAAVASDGFVPDLLPQVWGLKHARGLQRKLNVWGSQERRFRDDATIIAIERKHHDSGHD
jgi:hypothetical protein